MKAGRMMAIVAGTGAAVLMSASAEAAVTARVTGDDGNPALLTVGQPLGIRNMDAKAFVHVDDAAGARSYRWQVTDQSGVGATTFRSCRRSSILPDDETWVTYRGNQSYALTLTLYSDNNCATVASTRMYFWMVGASVSLGQPAGPLLTRQRNSFSTITQQLDFAGNPGAISYEIKYAKGAVLQPDGSISAPAIRDGYLDRTTGKVELIGAREPGTYTVVARAKSGDFYSPWSAPITLRLQAPFDISSRRFPDQRGPSYQVRGIVGETTAGGRVTLAVAKGKKGKKFRTLGKGKVNSKGVFKIRFKLSQRGTYRLRYSFKGTANVQKGTVYEVIKIRRVLG